jgi:Putative adhesin
MNTDGRTARFPSGEEDSMKSLAKSAAWVGLAVCTASAPLFAQLQDNSEKHMTCENGGSDGDRARHCEIREQTVPSAGRLSVDAGQNGGAMVKGWLRSDVLVRARVEASGDTEVAAASRASQVLIDSSGGQVQATGPQPANNTGWSVSYEIFVPQATDLTLKANNGGVTISDVRGEIHFDVNNGGVQLKRVAGDVSGATVNGGIQVELTGAIWDGRQMEVSTRNGGVTLAMPSYYSAHLQAETRSGTIQSDFPVATQGNIRPRTLDSNIGSGGPLIHVTTENGGVRLKRTESQ